MFNLNEHLSTECLHLQILMSRTIFFTRSVIYMAAIFFVIVITVGFMIITDFFTLSELSFGFPYELLNVCLVLDNTIITGYWNIFPKPFDNDIQEDI